MINVIRDPGMNLVKVVTASNTAFASFMFMCSGVLSREEVVSKIIEESLIDAANIVGVASVEITRLLSDKAAVWKSVIGIRRSLFKSCCI
jgi:hypothetical protein